MNDYLEPSFGAALRFSLAGIVFLPYVIWRGSKNVNLLKGGLEIGVYNAIGYYMQIKALLTTSASTTAFICSLAVIIVPILGVIFPRTHTHTHTNNNPHTHDHNNHNNHGIKQRKHKEHQSKNDDVSDISDVSDSDIYSNYNINDNNNNNNNSRNNGNGSNENNCNAWYMPLLPALVATMGVACLELGGEDIPGVGDIWACGEFLIFCAIFLCHVLFFDIC